MRALVTLEAIPAETAVPGRFNLAGQVPGERSDKLQHLALQVGLKHVISRKPRVLFKDCKGTKKRLARFPRIATS